MADTADPQDFNAYLAGLYGPDAFAEVRAASEAHRLEHAPSLAGGEQECGVYPSDALKMRVLTTIVRAIGAHRVLEIGGGFGYSALWFAAAMGESGHVETIDRFPQHIDAIERYATRFGVAERLTALPGEADAILGKLRGPYDVIHDDGWFGAEPPYYGRLAGLLRPGGLLVMSNWFLLEHAVAGQSPVDWSQYAGPTWAEDIRAYARRLEDDERYDVSFVQRPPFALAYRRTDA
jgi:predicted O-methyltransferase YrrM